LIFWLVLQVFPFSAVFFINAGGGYFRAVHIYVSFSLLKAALFALAFMFLFLSGDAVSRAIYGVGEEDKINASKRIDAALERCSQSFVLGLNCTRDSGR